MPKNVPKTILELINPVHGNDKMPILYLLAFTDLMDLWRLWAEIEAHKWRDLELNLSKTVEEFTVAVWTQKTFFPLLIRP